jgi:DNA-binding MarR family transcriptional regulator
MDGNDWHTAVAVLRLATQLVDGIQEGLAHRGFADIRPAHGFAFMRISNGDATTAKVAEHLGVTKQAGAQLVGYLVEHGYVDRRPDPRDGRARLLALTDRGRACTAAAEAAAGETVEHWRTRLRQSVFSQLETALDVLAEPGQLRPAW